MNFFSLSLWFAPHQSRVSLGSNADIGTREQSGDKQTADEGGYSRAMDSFLSRSHAHGKQDSRTPTRASNARRRLFQVEANNGAIKMSSLSRSWAQTVVSGWVKAALGQRFKVNRDEPNDNDFWWAWKLGGFSHRIKCVLVGWKSCRSSRHNYFCWVY